MRPYGTYCSQATPTALLISLEQDNRSPFNINVCQSCKDLVWETPQQGKNTVVKCHTQMNMPDTCREINCD